MIPSQEFESMAYLAYKTSLTNDKTGAYELEESVFKTYNTDYTNDTLKEPSQLLLFRKTNEGKFSSMLERNKRISKLSSKNKDGAIEVSTGKDKDTDTKQDTSDVNFNINDLTGSGPNATLRESKSITSLDFFNSEYFKKFKYSFGERTFYQGRELIKIDFFNKRKIEHTYYKGSVYLDFESLAIVAVDYNERAKIPFYVNLLLKTIVSFTIDNVERDVRVRNQPIDNIWYPKDVVFDIKITLKQKGEFEQISIAQLYNIQEIITADALPIEEEKRFDGELEYEEQIFPIDGVVWESINVIGFD